MNDTPKTIKINSFEHFVETIDCQPIAEGERLYRGQKEDWKLYPKLVRSVIENNKTLDYSEVEEQILQEFREKVCRLEGYTDLELLAIAQHFGLPTRLLDWSTDPLVALWFAFEKEKDNSNDRIVWGLVLNMFLYRDEEPVNTHHQRFLKAYRPQMLDPRLKAQRAWFIIQNVDFPSRNDSGDGLPRFSEMAPIEELEYYQYNLAKFIIPNHLRCEILEQLNLRGINHSTLYPELGTICQNITLKFFPDHKDFL
jgi:hypothetical protein